MVIASTATLAQTRPTGNDADIYYSSADVDTTPAGNVHFHGPFVNETLSARYDDIAAHDFLEISFDFLAIRSLNGSWPMKNNRPTAEGPNFVRLGLETGPTLFYTTFSNRPDDPNFTADSRFQNYPSQIPGEHLKPQSGAAATNTLGYGYPWPGAPRFFPMDATYHIHVIVPDHVNHNAVQLTGIGFATAISQSWGITDVSVKPMSKSNVPHPDEAAIDKAFVGSLDSSSNDLAGQFQTLILGMDQTVNWIRKNVTPSSVDTEQLQQLLQDLAADDAHILERDAASENLVIMGPLIEPYLRDRRATAVGAVRLRLDWALEQISDTPITDDSIRRIVLATRVLEIIRTPGALELRAKLTSKPSSN